MIWRFRYAERVGFGRHIGCLLVVGLAALVVSCADEEGPVAGNAVYTLDCPGQGSGVECGARDPDTCLRPAGGGIGAREIRGVNGEVSCDGISPLVFVCRGQENINGDLLIDLEASVPFGGGTTTDFGFDLDATITTDGQMITGNCEITITEDEATYGGELGGCGFDAPSMEQPCQVSNFVIGDPGEIDLSFDVNCVNLISSISTAGFDVAGTIQFARCDGL